MLWIAPIMAAVITVAIAEYSIHRWVMHHPRGGSSFHDHAIRHHAHKQNDGNVDLPMTTNFLIAIPLAMPVAFWWWQYSVCLMIVAGVHSLLWTMLHRSFHDVGCAFVKYLPLWRRLHVHHMEHHRQPTKNYGAVFGPLVDLALRTRRR